MEQTYLVGRSANADIRIPREHDAVGKRHLELTDLGDGRVRIADLKSTNGTFVRIGQRWEELKEARTLDCAAEIMLGDFRITPRELLDLVTATRVPAKPPRKAPPTGDPAVKRAPRLHRNEFGEIVRE